MAVARVQLPAPGGGAAVFVATCVQERDAEAPRLAQCSQEPCEGGGSQGDRVGTLHASSNQDTATACDPRRRGRRRRGALDEGMEMVTR